MSGCLGGEAGVQDLEVLQGSQMCAIEKRATLVMQFRVPLGQGLP